MPSKGSTRHQYLLKELLVRNTLNLLDLSTFKNPNEEKHKKKIAAKWAERGIKKGDFS